MSGTSKQYDVAALGELLVDLTLCGAGDGGSPLYAANPGGAPANVLAMLRKLGRRCAFLGKVGEDFFGDMLAETLRAEGIDLRGLRRAADAPTTLAVVSTAADGERDFSFYRSPGADTLLRPDELDEDALRHCRIFHFGSLSLTDEPNRSATARAIRLAREAGALLSFDPNLRPPLWRSPEDARAQILWSLTQCDLLKIADDELRFVTGTDDPDAGAAMLRERFPNLRLICVTAGAQGSFAFCGAQRVFQPAFSGADIVDTTGAGDAFCACMLHCVPDRGPEGLDEAAIRAMLRLGNAAGCLVSTRKGALRSMPTRAELNALLA